MTSTLSPTNHNIGTVSPTSSTQTGKKAIPFIHSENVLMNYCLVFRNYEPLSRSNISTECAQQTWTNHWAEQNHIPTLRNRIEKSKTNVIANATDKYTQKKRMLRANFTKRFDKKNSIKKRSNHAHC